MNTDSLGMLGILDLMLLGGAWILLIVMLTPQKRAGNRNSSENEQMIVAVNAMQLRKEAWKKKKIQDFNGVWRSIDLLPTSVAS